MSSSRFRVGMATAFLLVCIGGFFTLSLKDREERASREGDNAPDALNERGYNLDLHLAAIQHLSEARKRIARRVVAGKLSLLQGAARFQDLNETCDDFSWEDFRTRFPAATDDERACRQVIQFAKLELDQDSLAGALPIAKVERELEDLLRQGRVHLPR
jgi:hypothetical protein